MLEETNKLQIEDLLLKVIVIGDSSVGKSNIVLQFSENNFSEGHQPTIGVDFKMKSLEVDKVKLKLQIWDTAGQERYKTLAKTYYKGACGVLLVYSITDDVSFSNIGYYRFYSERWIKEVHENIESPS